MGCDGNLRAWLAQCALRSFPGSYIHFFLGANASEMCVTPCCRLAGCSNDKSTGLEGRALHSVLMRCLSEDFFKRVFECLRSLKTRFL